MEFGDLSENPFARVAVKEKHKRHRALVRAFQVFVLVAIATGGILVLANQSKHWLAGRLLADFDGLGASQKVARLGQLAELGVFGVEPLVNSMADEDTGVARTGYELLRTAQNNWTVLPLEDEKSRHELLVEAVKTIAIELPDHRTGWGTSLMQQTLLFTSEHPLATVDLRDRTSNAITLLALSGRPEQTAAMVELESGKFGRLDVQGGPLPVDGIQSIDDWTTWPPSQPVARNVTGGVSESQPSQIEGATSDASFGSPGSTQFAGNFSNAKWLGAVPTVYKSGASRLQLIGENEVVQLADVADSVVVDSEGNARAVQSERAVHRGDFSNSSASDAHAQVGLVVSPMAAFDDTSVMRWLGSPHAALREKAKLELVSRGFDGTAIAIATRIFSGDINQKIELVDALASTSAIEPRRWLLLLLQDPDRDVRLRTVSSLGTMDDPAIAGRLQAHLDDERDPAVASRIRRVLDLR